MLMCDDSDNPYCLQSKKVAMKTTNYFTAFKVNNLCQ